MVRCDTSSEMSPSVREFSRLVRAREALASAKEAGWENDLVAIYEECVQTAEAKNAVFQAMLVKTAGMPLGIELARENGRQYVAIVPDAHHPGKARCQYFDGNGFSSHQTTETAFEALEMAIDEGFITEVPGALDRLSQTAEWAEGMRVAALIMACNAGQMSWADAVDAIHRKPH